MQRTVEISSTSQSVSPVETPLRPVFGGASQHRAPGRRIDIAAEDFDRLANVLHVLSTADGPFGD